MPTSTTMASILFLSMPMRLGALLLALFLYSGTVLAQALDSSDLPSAPEPATPVQTEAPALKLPRHFQIEYASQRSILPGKIRYGLSTTYSPRLFIDSFLIAGYPNLPEPPHQPNPPPDPITHDIAENYLGQMTDYENKIFTWRRASDRIVRDRAYRLGTGAATAETRLLLSNLALPLVLHQNARYELASIDAPFGARMAHAALSIVLTRGDRGNIEPNYSKLVGTFGAAILGEQVYAPLFKATELAKPRFIYKYAGLSLAGDLATNVGHELVRTLERPDIQMYNLHGGSRDDSYYPLSFGGKFIYWARSTYELRNQIEADLISGLPRIPKQPKEPQDPGQISNPVQELKVDEAYIQYCRDLQHWREGIENDVRYRLRRHAGGLAESETQLLLQNFAIPVATGMDPRYIPMGPGYAVGDRAGYALRSLFIGHTDAGNRFVNLPVLGGTIAAAFLAKESYYPALGTPALSSTRVLTATIGLNLLADGISNELNEFFRHRRY